MSGTIAIWALVGACGGGTPPGEGPDAAVPDIDAAAPPDTPVIAACHEFEDPEQVVGAPPMAIAGDLAGAGADMEAPDDCAIVDAPFGVSSAGADAVFEIDNLVPETDYVVRLDSSEDLAFYVVTGCNSQTGPTGTQCALFEDAQTAAAEVGKFNAGPGGTAFVVVDYYAAGYPPATDFTLQLYAAECTDSGQCGGTTPVCQDFRCSGCGSDFDCDDPATPLCDEPTYTCVAGTSGCAGDDGHENGDDGPAGATLLTPGVGASGAICDSPSTEMDFYRFHVASPGEDVTFQLDWGSSADLDLRVFDASGALAGMSFFEHPEHVALTYLPQGDYYAAVDYYSSNGTSLATSYTITATSQADACTGPADCAAEYDNQIFRGNCVGGACKALDGDGAVPLGGRCDSVSDCAGGLMCPSFFFTADADTRMVCGNDCNPADSGACAGLGAGYVCTDNAGYTDYFCMQKCSSDDQCAIDTRFIPTVPPWWRLSCNVTTGRCE